VNSSECRGRDRRPRASTEAASARLRRPTAFIGAGSRGLNRHRASPLGDLEAQDDAGRCPVWPMPVQAESSTRTGRLRAADRGIRGPLAYRLILLQRAANDSAETPGRSSQVGGTSSIPLSLRVAFKTVDNDLAITRQRPGFGSVAKNTSRHHPRGGVFRKVASMAKKITRLVVWNDGRHGGGITAACGLAATSEGRRPRS